MEGSGAAPSFVEWGGAGWSAQLDRGLAWLGDVSGLRVLDLGTRYGRMATWFALEGADVLGVDVSPEPLMEARRFAVSRGVGKRVEFATYSGDPVDLPHDFDVIFAKSVVVLMDIERAVEGFALALRPNGRILLVENARGPLLMHILRMVRRMSLRPHGASYFTPETVSVIRRRFDVELEHWAAPTVVIGGRLIG